MTEAEWLAGNETGPMLDWLRGHPSRRKKRLLGCAVCRGVWHLLPDAASRRAVEVAEDFADGLATVEELGDANWSAEATCFRYDRLRSRDQLEEKLIVTGWLDEDGPSDAERLHLEGHAAWIAEGATSGDFNESVRAEDVTAEVFRDIFGNPFRPVAFLPAWLTPTAVGIAEAIYADRAFDRLPILADALQDAGCEDADVLAHCRGDGPHVRGCWVVDGVLGKG